MDELQNPNPIIFKAKKLDEETKQKRKFEEQDPDIEDELDELESIIKLISILKIKFTI